MAAPTTTAELFDAFEKLTVLVIGDVMLDSYIWGSVDRISPEAPVPIVRVTQREKRLGGAANVALNVQALGATPILCSIIGDDMEGDAFNKLLAQHNITQEGIIKSKTRITTLKERVLSGSQHILRVDSEMEGPLDGIEEKSLIQHIKSLIAKCDLVIFEDYDKGTLNAEVIKATIAAASERNIPVAVDPKQKNFNHYVGATLFKPNLRELSDGLKMPLAAHDEAGISKAVASLKEKLALNTALITLSDRGIYINSPEKEAFYPAHIRRISDVSGAGDTVISIAAMCLTLGLDPAITARLANLGGGLVCEYMGVVPVNKADLMAETSRRNLFEAP